VASVRKDGRGVFNNGVTFGNPSSNAYGIITGTNAPQVFSLETYQLFVFQVGIAFPNTGSLSTAARLVGDGENGIAQRNGTNAQILRVYDTYASTTNYHRLAIATARATATAMSGATITLTNIIPAGAVVVGVTCKVTTAITGATSFQLGTAGDPDRFGATIAIAAGTTSDNRDWTSGTIECLPAATSLILTANDSNFTAGAVYVSVQYLSGQAD
jgi:hypothetical protein